MKTSHQQNRVAPLHRVASAVLVGALLILGACQGGGTPEIAQRYFATADEATDALLLACEKNDLAALTAVLGSEHQEVYITSDPAADQQSRRLFCELAAKKQLFQEAGPDTLEVVVGEDEWPLPIPLVKTPQGWHFDTAAGAEEIINRRIGRNEIEAIELCRGVLYAQQQYVAIDWDNDGRGEYAQKIKASPGKTDGLFWVADEARGPSPLDGFILNNEDYANIREEGTPWRGYYGKLLTAQGPHAPGGAQSWLTGDDLLEGFAGILCPAEYGNSGVMSFMVSHYGTVYEKDLGPDGLEIGKAMATFDPDPSWTPVQ